MSNMEHYRGRLCWIISSGYFINLIEFRRAVDISESTKKTVLSFL